MYLGTGKEEGWWMNGGTEGWRERRTKQSQPNEVKMEQNTQHDIKKRKRFRETQALVLIDSEKFFFWLFSNKGPSQEEGK